MTNYVDLLHSMHTIARCMNEAMARDDDSVCPQDRLYWTLFWVDYQRDIESEIEARTGASVMRKPRQVGVYKG